MFPQLHEYSRTLYLALTSFLLLEFSSSYNFIFYCFLVLVFSSFHIFMFLTTLFLDVYFTRVL
ncbi:UNVERIFIED_ORG: putative membrane protein [Clostridioides difficile F501]